MWGNSSDADFNTRLPLAHLTALSDPEQFIATYLGSSTIGFCILDPDLRFLSVNEALAGMHGLPARHLIGKTIREVLGESADEIDSKVKSVLLTGKPIFNFEFSTINTGQGQTRYWIDNLLPIKDAAGNITRVALVVTEATQQRKVQESLQSLIATFQKEAQRLRMLLDVTSLVTSNWDIPQVFPRVSARIRRILRHEYASFALQDTNSGLLVRQALDFPLGKGFTSAVQPTAGNTPAGDVLRSRGSKIFSRQDLQAFDPESTQSFLEEGLQSLCYVPLLRPKGPLGVLVLGSTRSNAFQPDDLQLLEQVAAQLSVAIENHRAGLEIEELKKRLGEERRYLEGENRSEGQFSEIVGESPALRRVLDQAATVAPSEATVLILGETGTGKELIARAIHRMSRRKDDPFIKVNCAAIPTGLLESELFGHEKGAFTGAINRKVGRIELADGGTIFLDEIGEIPLDLQPKLLRVLQDQEFERLGSNRTIRVDVRLVAATNRDLAKVVEEHQFRSDLFYRLHVFPIRVPPLRERREDIPLLVRYFVRKFALRMDRYIETIPKDTISALTAWRWPGNIRELENLMERSVILSEGKALRVPISEINSGSVSEATDHSLDNAERQHIIRILREAGGLLSGPKGAAHRLGLKRTTLQSKMQRLKISREDYTNH